MDTGRKSKFASVKIERSPYYHHKKEYFENSEKNPSVIDLFCGCGGASCGVVQAGYDLWCGIDLAKDALATYESNLGNAIMGDVRHLPLRVDLRPDLLIGCPPCPAFSITAASARKRNPMTAKRHKEQAKLLLWFAIAVQWLAPKAIFFENVPPAAKSLEFLEMCYALKYETLPPYEIKWEILDAANYGVPQRRKRVILIGLRSDDFTIIASNIDTVKQDVDYVLQLSEAMLAPQRMMIEWVRPTISEARQIAILRSTFSRQGLIARPRGVEL